MAQTADSYNARWTRTDRRLARGVARRMVAAGLWSRLETAGFRPGGFLEAFCPGRPTAAYEFGRAPDGRYVLIDRLCGAVSFHRSLAAALAQVAALPCSGPNAA